MMRVVESSQGLLHALYYGQHKIATVVVDSDTQHFTSTRKFT